METPATTQSQELSIIERSVDIFKSGGPILLANQQRSARAVAVGQNILEAIRANGMTPELDERAQKYLVNCATALKEENEHRSAITQLMDEIKKMFTSAEALIDAKKEGTYPNLIQKERDTYARKVAEKQKEKQRLAQLEADKKTEAINIRAQIENLFAQHYAGILAESKSLALGAFNGINLDSYTEMLKKYTDYSPKFPEAKVYSFNPNVLGRLVDASEINRINVETIEGNLNGYRNNLNGYRNNYSAEMSLFVQDLLDKMPSKLSELKEEKRKADEAEAARIEAKRKADEAEAERQRQLAAQKDEQARKALEAQQKQERKAEQERLDKIEQDRKAAEQKAAQEKKDREEAEQRKIEQEKQEQERKASEAISIKAEGDKTMALFEKDAASVADAPAPETRTGYDIIVTHQVGYGQIFQFWFEREGKNLPLDKMGNTKLDQMKAFAEKLAMKTGEKIESKYLSYQDSYKAVNRKAKAE